MPGGIPPSAKGVLPQLFGNLFKTRTLDGNGDGPDKLADIIEEHQGADGVIDEDQQVLLEKYPIVAKQDDLRCHGAPRRYRRGGYRRGASRFDRRDDHRRPLSIPVYRENLDDAVGMAHIKDVLACRDEKSFRLTNILRRVLVVSPSMQVLELLLEMRVTRCHMALVVDEYGGIDGLVTIEDLVEEIVGEIEDEHDREYVPNLIKRPDGSYDADARAPIEQLEKIVGAILADEEQEDIDTLGGLVFALAGRVPIRGELVRHDSGLEFEVIEADPRRIKQLVNTCRRNFNAGRRRFDIGRGGLARRSWLTIASGPPSRFPPGSQDWVGRAGAVSPRFWAP